MEPSGRSAAKSGRAYYNLMYRKDTVLHSRHVPAAEVALYRKATANYAELRRLFAANYAEASEPESDADFVHKLKVALKELKESRAWLRFARELIRDPFVDDVIRESHEIQRMMGASLRTRGCCGWASRMNTEN